MVELATGGTPLHGTGGVDGVGGDAAAVTAAGKATAPTGGTGAALAKLKGGLSAAGAGIASAAGKAKAAMTPGPDSKIRAMVAAASTAMGKVGAAGSERMSALKEKLTPSDAKQARLKAFKDGALALGTRFSAATGKCLRAIGAFLKSCAEAAGRGAQFLLGGFLCPIGGALKGIRAGYKDRQMMLKGLQGDSKKVPSAFSFMMQRAGIEGKAGMETGKHWMQIGCTAAGAVAGKAWSAAGGAEFFAKRRAAAVDPKSAKMAPDAVESFTQALKASNLSLFGKGEPEA